MIKQTADLPSHRIYAVTNDGKQKFWSASGLPVLCNSKAEEAEAPAVDEAASRQNRSARAATSGARWSAAP